MIDPARLIEPTEDFILAFPNLHFQNRRGFISDKHSILLADPINISDIYNSTDETSRFLQEHGLFLMDFGGDMTASIWWHPPFLWIPVATSLADQKPAWPSTAQLLFPSISSDSASLMFLPLTSDIPPNVLTNIQSALNTHEAVVLNLPAGRWTAYYEQLNQSAKIHPSLCRNIVLKHSSDTNQ